MSKLLVIVPDAISAILVKGEYQPRYYNPGNLFEEVHILMCNNDKPDPRELQKTVGSARLFLHNLPETPQYFLQNTKWFKPWLLQPWAKPFLWAANRLQFRLLNEWAQPAVELARQIEPDLIRCHGNDSNAYVASRIKKELGIPYAVSLHINPDINQRRRNIFPDAPPQEKLFAIFFDAVEIEGLKHADIVLPVYKPIIPYLKRAKISKYEVAYNVLAGDFLLKKDDYALHNPVRVISVGRHFYYKNPENLIRAIHDIPNVHLTLVGDGPYQADLESLAHECGLDERVTFLPAVNNDELCKMLPEYDIFAVHTEHFELSKSVLEALLTGMPVIINRRVGAGGQVPELQGDFMMMVDNTRDGYAGAIKKLMGDHAMREGLGRKAYAHAQECWAPAKTEAKYVEIYKRMLAEKRK